jgi:2-(3-amino-3-carboxypropyl)histidine synthase
MHNDRRSIETARDARVIGLILGTLGRQGNKAIFQRLKSLAERKGRTIIPFLMAEINLEKLATISQVEVTKLLLFMLPADLRNNVID